MVHSVFMQYGVGQTDGNEMLEHKYHNAMYAASAVGRIIYLLCGVELGIINKRAIMLNNAFQIWQVLG